MIAPKPMPSLEDGPITWAFELIGRVVGAWLGAIFTWTCIGLVASAALVLFLSSLGNSKR